MREPLLRTKHLVQRLRARWRVLLTARAAAQVGGVLGACVLALSYGPGLGVGRVGATVGLGLFAAAGLSWVLAALARGWGASSPLDAHATCAESLRPELGGRLHAALRYADNPQDAASPALVELLARRVTQNLEGLEPAQVYPGKAAARALALSSLWLCVALAIATSRGVSWSFWLGEPVAIALVGAAAESPQARIGDISLRYVYPPYTGLESRTVPNSTGAVEAPPGTVVELRFRSQSVFERASLVVGDLAPLDAVVEDGGRVATAQFSVGAEPSTWRVDLVRGEGVEPSEAFPITPVPDLPPVVTVEGPDTLEVAVDEPLSLAWRARDDFGVQRVELRVDDAPRRLSSMGQEGPEWMGDVFETPAELGLAPGDHAQVVLTAWDNDTVSGSKRGDSRTLQIIVTREDGLDPNTQARQEELLRALVLALADFLEEPWPPGRTEARVARWGEAMAARLEPLQELALAYKGSRRRYGLEDQVLSDVMGPLGELIRYTQVAFTPGVTTAPADSAWENTSELREQAVVALEDGVFALDRALRMRAMREVVQQTKELAEQGVRLQALLNESDADRLELLGLLDRIAPELEELSQAVERLENGGFRDFMSARTRELTALDKLAKEELGAGREDEAERLMGLLARGLRETNEWVQDELEAAQRRRDETADQVAELREELLAIEQEQRAVQSAVSSLREEQDAGQAQQIAAAWERLDRAASALQREGEAYRVGLGEADRAFYEQERASQAVEDGQRLLESVRARDLLGAQRDAGEADVGWTRARYTLEREQRNTPSLKGPGTRQMRAIEEQLQTIARALEQLDSASISAVAQSTPQSEALTQRQSDLGDRLRAATAKARKVAQEMPVQPHGLEEALQEAKEQMNTAQRELEQGRSLPAEGAQGVAAEQVRKAREALEQAQQSAEQQEQGDGEGSGTGSGEDDAGGESHSGEQDMGRGSRLAAEVEDFSAEAYRRALLEGMTGEVPEGYRALKRRYYEELVR